jgi:hypothetical protein
MSLKPAIASHAALEGGDLAAEPSKRNALLCEAPLVLGASWASIWCERLRDEGRHIAGGWPGTLQEARSRVQEYFDRELPTRGMPLLTRPELDAATTATYERARSNWLTVVREAKATLQGARR